MDELAGCLLGLLPTKWQTAIILLAILGLMIFFSVAIYREVSADTEQPAASASRSDSGSSY